MEPLRMSKGHQVVKDDSLLHVVCIHLFTVCRGHQVVLDDPLFMVSRVHQVLQISSYVQRTSELYGVSPHMSGGHQGCVDLYVAEVDW